jgi:hypothetical protein
MSLEAIQWVIEQSPYKGVRYTLHLMVADTVNPKNGNKFWMAAGNLATRARTTRSYTTEVLADFCSDGFLEVIEARPGLPTVYRFLFPSEPASVCVPGSELAMAEGVRTADTHVSGPMTRVSSEVSPGVSTGGTNPIEPKTIRGVIPRSRPAVRGRSVSRGSSSARVAPKTGEGEEPRPSPAPPEPPSSPSALASYFTSKLERIGKPNLLRVNNERALAGEFKAWIASGSEAGVIKVMIDDFADEIDRRGFRGGGAVWKTFLARRQFLVGRAQKVVTAEKEKTITDPEYWIGKPGMANARAAALRLQDQKEGVQPDSGSVTNGLLGTVVGAGTASVRLLDPILRLGWPSAWKEDERWGGQLWARK